MNRMCLKRLAAYLLVCLIGLSWIGCSQRYKDTHTKADIATKAKTELDFVGVNYTVVGGVVTLIGKCPTQKARVAVEKKVSEIVGVKQVVNQIAIAPVVINADYPLQQAVDSVCMKYAQALGHVQDSIVTVKGEVEHKELTKLMTALDSLHARKVENQLAVKR